MGEYESLVELFKRISEISPGPSPNEGFGVPAPQPEPGRLGMSASSRGMGGALQQLQQGGVRPPMPGQQGGLGQKSALFELLRLLTEAGAMQQQGVQAPAAPEQQQTGTVGGSRNLLQELLGGMHE
jgi:hypothetical protein